MAEPITTAATIATLIKIVGPLLLKLRRVDPQATLDTLIRKFATIADPAITAAVRKAGVSGTAVTQNLATAVGTAGGGRSGVGAAVTNLGDSVSGTRSFNALQRGNEQVSQLALQALPSVLQSQAIDAAIPGRLNNLFAGLGQAGQITGEDPIEAALQALFNLGGGGGRSSPTPAGPRGPRAPTIQRPQGTGGGTTSRIPA